MDSRDVTAARAEALANRVGPMLGYLTRLRDRMQRRAWAADDPLYVDAKAAQDAMHRLHLAFAGAVAAAARHEPEAAAVGAGRERQK